MRTDQVDKQFVPYVKPIPVGATVHFPNSDNIRHQVYSFSPASAEWRIELKPAIRVPRVSGASSPAYP